jgi:hypothetical protein
MNFVHFIPASFFRSVQGSHLGTWMRSTHDAFAITETIHLLALSVLLGTIVATDLRLLGYGKRRQSAAELAGDLAPFTWTALVVMMTTGVLLVFPEAVRIGRSISFFYKMIFLSLAILIHLTIYRKATRPGGPQDGWFGKLAGAFSLVLWLGVAVSGRAIAYPVLLHFLPHK